MPADVSTALQRLYDTTPKSHPESQASEWIHTIDLHLNFIAQSIFTLWHCTGRNKAELMADEIKRYWFYPYTRLFLRAIAKVLKGRNCLNF